MESVFTVEMKWIAGVVEAAMRVNCAIRALEHTTALDALERAAALAALLDGLRISGNRKLHATLLCHPKDVVDLPWEKLGGNDPDRWARLVAGELWDPREGKKEFVPMSKQARVHCIVREFVVQHSTLGLGGSLCDLANVLLSFRRSKRGKHGAHMFRSMKRPRKLGAHASGQ